jgi:hypothetical protein
MKLRNIFLPHKKNNYHPHILKPVGLAVVLALIIIQPLAYNTVTAHRFQVLGYATDVNASSLYSLTNQQRAAAGLPGLSLNSQLTAAAQNKAADMFAKNYWAHNSPDGLTPWYFISGAGYQYSAAGENLAEGFDTSDGVMTGWMNSPGHRANILNSLYKDVGIAVMNGTLLGSPTTLVVAEYGAPLAAAAVPAQTAPPPAAKPQARTASPAPVPTPTPAAAAEAAPAQEQPAAATPEAATSPSKKASVAAGTSSPTDVKGVNVKKNGPDIPLPVIARAATLQALNWGQRTTVFLLSVLLLVNILKHTMIWRSQKRGYKHIWLRAHPVAQTAVLLIAIMVTISSSYGVII